MESKIKQLRRMEKINLAIELFEKDNVLNHSVSSIAKMLGIQRKSFYAYFKNYESLLAEIALSLEKDLVEFQDKIFQRIKTLDVNSYEIILIYAHLLSKELLEHKADKLKLSFQINNFINSLPPHDEVYQNYIAELKLVKEFIPLNHLLVDYFKDQDVKDDTNNKQLIVELFFQNLSLQNNSNKDISLKIAYLDNLIYFLIHSI